MEPRPIPTVATLGNFATPSHTAGEPSLNPMERVTWASGGTAASGSEVVIGELCTPALRHAVSSRPGRSRPCLQERYGYNRLTLGPVDLHAIGTKRMFVSDPALVLAGFRSRLAASSPRFPCLGARASSPPSGTLRARCPRSQRGIAHVCASTSRAGFGSQEPIGKFQLITSSTLGTVQQLWLSICGSRSRCDCIVAQSDVTASL